MNTRQPPGASRDIFARQALRLAVAACLAALLALSWAGPHVAAEGGASSAGVPAQICIQITKPDDPVPATGATGQSLDVDLAWAPDRYTDWYEVYLGTIHPDVAPLPYLGRTSASLYPLPRLTCGVRYYWYVIAHSDCGTGQTRWGDLWEFNTTCCLPSAPANPSPADGVANQSLDVNLNWADAPGATSYDVKLSTDPAHLPVVDTTTWSAYSPDTLTCKTRYYWQVVARNSCGVTEGPVWDFYTTCCMPDEPASPVPADGATNLSPPATDVLNWADAAHATSYDVYLSPRYAIVTRIPFYQTVDGRSSASVELTCGAHYYWYVMAKNVCGEAQGPVWDFTTACCAPSAPSGPSPANGAVNQSLNADLNWADAANATAYDIYFGTAASPPLVGDAIASSFALPALSPNTRYYWKIVAANACQGVEGPIWTFTTQASGEAAWGVHLPMVLRR